MGQEKIGGEQQRVVYIPRMILSNPLKRGFGDICCIFVESDKGWLRYIVNHRHYWCHTGFPDTLSLRRRSCVVYVSTTFFDII